MSLIRRDTAEIHSTTVLPAHQATNKRCSQASATIRHNDVIFLREEFYDGVRCQAARFILYDQFPCLDKVVRSYSFAQCKVEHYHIWAVRVESETFLVELGTTF